MGLRYYANLDLHHNLKKIKSERLDIVLINYGVNVDFLGNFVVTEMVDFGGFIGVGIGGNTLTGKYIKDLKESVATLKTTGFDIWLNLGLRTNIATHHGLELVARVPFLPMKMVDYSYTLDTGDAIKDKQTFKQTYSILARYTFSF